MQEPSSSKFPGISRSSSIASTISSSGASLSRRSRTTRKRTRTITTKSRPDDSRAEEDQVLDISAANSAEPFPSPVKTDSSERGPSPVTTRLETTISPFSSPVNLQPHLERSGETLDAVGGDLRVVVKRKGPSALAESQLGSQSLVGFTPTIPIKGRGRGNKPMLTSPPSAFRSNPTDSDHARSSVRDSLLTQQSSTSSSLYPLTTSIGTESPPSPLSPAIHDHGVIIPALEIDEPTRVQEFNADDVSYRLQLLVKNNYFLPPAHLKPCSADFPPCTNTPKKATTPAFLDYFRVGKSKYKPASPDSFDGSPMLRVTSDSTTVSGYVSRGTPQAFRSPKNVQHLARVVVVREQMDDLIAAAKQAEIDLKGRDVPPDRDRGVRRPKVDVFDGIIDPTEAVDVPPPSANYTLALQASALHGLGIEDSVGAAVLAERLPPAGSPGHSISLDPQEDAWRKALLHQAVGHSLNNSAVTSVVSLSTAPSTPTRSPHHLRSSESLYQRALTNPRNMLDKKILENPIVDHLEELEPPIHTVGAPSDRDLVARLPPRENVRLSSYTPLRAETPVPQTPLAPPPRRQLGDTQFSHSQSYLPAGSTELRRTLRKSCSSPMLSDFYELRRTSMMSPPSLPSLSISPPPSHRMSRMTALTGFSRLTDDSTAFDDIRSRPSLAISVPATDGGHRPSFSEYSQPSPTASAFRDRWSNSYYPHNFQSLPVDPLSHSQHSHSSMSPPAPTPRPSTMSPPPRPSSSIVGIALSPPPHRSGNNTNQPRPSRLHEALSFNNSSSSQGTFHSFKSFSPLPSNSGTQSHLLLPLDVNVSIDSFVSGIQSAPPPSSPASFFDHIQNHPNAMDDLDDSEDSRSDMDQDMSVYRDPEPSPHPSLMHLGNRSTPSIARTANELQGSPTERHKPISNIPQKTPYFTDVKSSPNSLTHLTLAQHSQEHLTVDASAPQQPDVPGSENVRRWQKEQQALAESSKRLDGMLIQHMEAEKDTLRRIAQTAKVSKP
ncbi:uncharacterized protein EDB93DRAFT_1173984 [Suillus bovinus]|uniref:uncharacterized protein n=1 Tax=Suillus bovinus TaxID=48563 RepID=UPI001B85F81A|nr:uncharacterized protein EDB93DRAFT_1173984 [Suillus bovinus]KAG2133659.1 hypothetical protein EDB93DRAFT_1173984 [Suillus bovinus]